MLLMAMMLIDERNITLLTMKLLMRMFLMIETWLIGKVLTFLMMMMMMMMTMILIMMILMMMSTTMLFEHC